MIDQLSENGTLVLIVGMALIAKYIFTMFFLAYGIMAFIKYLDQK